MAMKTFLFIFASFKCQSKSHFLIDAFFIVLIFIQLASNHIIIIQYIVAINAFD